MEIKQEILFDGTDGLDWDTVEEKIKSGDSRYRYNCLGSVSNIGNNAGGIHNVPGNVLKSLTTIPHGVHTAIGSCSDIENNSILWFVYNSLSQHFIARYKYQTDVAEIVVTSSKLNFQLSHKITHANIINGILYWTDGYFNSWTDYNPPRKLDIEKAINLGAIGGYLAITDQILDAVTYPPLFKPTVNYASDPDYKSNNMRGYVWQFAYQYVYYDFQKSTWSPVSKALISLGEEFINGDYVENVLINNCIDIIVNTGSGEVTKINIAARQGNIGDFVQVGTLEKYDGTTVLIPSSSTHTYRFFNNRAGLSLDQQKQSRLFDWVPQIAGCQELIEDNMLTYGDCTEGYDNVSVDVNLQHDYEEIPFGSGLGYLSIAIESVILPGSAPPLAADMWAISLPVVTPPLGATISVRITNPAKSVDFTVTTTCLGSGYPYNNIVELINLIGTHLYDPAVPGNYYIAFFSSDPYKFYVMPLVTVYGVETCTGYVNYTAGKYLNCKQGAFHEFGLVYYDRANRSGGTNIHTESMVKYMPYVTEYPYYLMVPGDIYTSQIRTWFDWQINHLAPLWSTHYQWVYTKNTTIGKSVYLPISSIVLDGASNKLKIDLNTYVTSYISKNKKTILSTYVWNKGNRIRFIKRKNSVGYSYFGSFLDYEILSQESAGATEIYIQNFDYASYNIAKDTIVEVYSPKKILEAKIFYEVGAEFETVSGTSAGRFHKGDIQDQTVTLPAKGSFKDIAGDSYVRFRAMDISFPVEDPSVSDFYESDDYPLGRPNAVDENMRRKRLNIVRHGGKWLQNTRVNELTTFDYDDYETFDERYGLIYKTILSGYTLKVIQKVKNTSIYIGRIFQYDAEGKEYLVTSDRIFGTKMIPAEDWGTVNPESVKRYKRYTYFYDITHDAVIRDAPNGMIDITAGSYRMKNYFKDRGSKFKHISLGYKTFAYAGMDDINEYYYLSFEGWEDTGSVILPFNETICFHETSNRWKTFFTGYKLDGTLKKYIECFGNIDNVFVCFVDGQIWIQNVSTVYNNFFGVKQPCMYEFYGNILPNKIKDIASLDVYSNKRWGSPYSDDIVILPSEQFPAGMQSKLPAERYVLTEGIYHAHYLQDTNTPMPGSYLQKLMNGRDLRGQVFRQRLWNDHDQEVVLTSIIIKMQTSELSG